jgi:CRISPR-associated protein Csm5
MAEKLGLYYRLDIEVLTPLHVGNGVTLLKGFDFAVRNGLTYRLDENAILNDRWPDDPELQRRFLGQPLADLLESSDYQQHPEYFYYTLRGEPAMREIREHIKDAQGRPYLPGSSLKGALRTALLRALTDKRVFRRSDFGQAGGAREAKQAAQSLEHGLLGSTPNRDVLRALRIGDSAPVSTAALTLQRVQMVPNLQIDVEALGRGTRLTGSLAIDTWLLEQRGQRGLDWSDQLAQRIQRIGQVTQFVALRRLRHEWQYHAGRRDQHAAIFYGKRFEEANSGAWPRNEFLVQVGFAAGWRAKTVLGGLADDDPLLERIVHDFSLDRGGGRGRGYTQGEPFPKARHLAWVGGNPALPLGWLRVRMEKVAY